MTSNEENKLQCGLCENKITHQSISGLCKRCVNMDINKDWKNYVTEKFICKICKKKIYGRGSSGLCKRCSNTGRKHSEKTIEKLRIMNSGKNNPNYGKIRSLETRRKISISQIGRKATLRSRKNMSIAHLGMRQSLESKRKISKGMRLVAIERTKKLKFNGHQVIPSWNPTACQKIDEYGKQYGYNFQHAMNGGEFFIEELGYWVDGYDKGRNTVIEYYEKHHDRQVQKDFERETEICNHLSCDFIILWENQ